MRVRSNSISISLTEFKCWLLIWKCRDLTRIEHYILRCYFMNVPFLDFQIKLYVFIFHWFQSTFAFNRWREVAPYLIEKVLLLRWCNRCSLLIIWLGFKLSCQGACRFLRQLLHAFFINILFIFNLFSLGFSFADYSTPRFLILFGRGY